MGCVVDGRVGNTWQGQAIEIPHPPWVVCRRVENNLDGDHLLMRQCSALLIFSGGWAPQSGSGVGPGTSGILPFTVSGLECGGNESTIEDCVFFAGIIPEWNCSGHDAGALIVQVYAQNIQCVCP